MRTFVATVCLWLVIPSLIQADWCHDDLHGSEDEFTAALIILYGDNATCTMTLSGLEHLALDLGTESSHDDHDDHDHTHGASLLHKSSEFIKKLRYSSNPARAVEVKAPGILQHAPFDSHNHTDVTETCYTVDELLEVFNLTDHVSQGLSKNQFENLCPALLQQSLQGCVSEAASSSSSSPSDLEMYGLGSVAVFVISISSLFGLIVYRWRNSSAYQYIICVMLGLSVGALVGDAILHLGPQALGVHDHGEDEHDHGNGIVIEDYVWKMVVCLAAIWGFFILQMSLEYANMKTGHGHSHGAVKDVHMNSIEEGNVNKGYSDSNGDIASTKSEHEKSEHTKHHERLDHNQNQEKAAIQDKAVAWMVMIGDSVHNFADGMTIGASFAVDWQTGMATSIAVFCHELPHEFGDIAALLASGWSVKKVALVNFTSACVAFIGLYIGIPVATSLDAESWILASAMGMFLYVGLANILPEIMENFKQNPSFKLALASNLGIFFGFLVMFIIAVFEDQIQF